MKNKRGPKTDREISSFKQECIPNKNLKLLVECALSCPGNNAATERVFSLGNVYWSSEKTQLIKTLASYSINR